MSIKKVSITPAPMSAELVKSLYEAMTDEGKEKFVDGFHPDYHATVRQIINGEQMILKKEFEALELLIDDKETSYWEMPAACLITGQSEAFLRQALNPANLENIEGLSCWWDEEIGNSGDYDFAIHVCDAHYNKHADKDKPICTCPEK